MELTALVLVLAVAIAAVLWWRSRGKADAGRSRPEDALDTAASWEPTPTRILTAQERLAYAVLERGLPDYVILAQVPLSRFLKVPTRNSYTEWLGRVGQLCADLLVCDHSSTVIAVIDVRQPPQQASERHRKRHDRMKRVLKAAGIPLHVWIENALPTPDAARAAILAKIEETAAAEAAAKTPAGAAARTAVLPTLEDETAGIIADEVIEMGEPPPSTWFDNLESGPVPLRQVPKPAPADKQPAKPR
jgi:hypothetical protein